MRTYQITWDTGAKNVIKGTNYINALYVNHITPSMSNRITNHKLLV